jgi:Recombination endonuclease VII
MRKGQRKRFCVNGHDTFVAGGRYARGHCAECARQKTAKHKTDHPDKVKQASDKWFSNNQHYVRRRTLAKSYWTPELYDAVFLAQDGTCAICGREETAKHQNGKLKRLAADHCHETNQPRGLLCQQCNHAIGGFADNVERLAAAIAYIMKYRSK